MFCEKQSCSGGSFWFDQTSVELNWLTCSNHPLDWSPGFSQILPEKNLQLKPETIVVSVVWWGIFIYFLITDPTRDGFLKVKQPIRNLQFQSAEMEAHCTTPSWNKQNVSVRKANSHDGASVWDKMKSKSLWMCTLVDYWSRTNIFTEQGRSFFFQIKLFFEKFL